MGEKGGGWTDSLIGRSARRLGSSQCLSRDNIRLIGLAGCLTFVFHSNVRNVHLRKSRVYHSGRMSVYL